MAKQLNTNNKIENNNVYDKNVKTNYKNEYENFYASMNKKKDKKKEEERIKQERKKKKILISILMVVIVIIIFLLIKIIIDNNDDNSDVNLLVNRLEIIEGESKYIPYEIVNYQNVLKIVFKSDDESIAKVDQNGNVIGIRKGSTRVTLQYESNNSTKEKICDIIILENGSNTSILPSLVVEYNNDDKWINSDAIIKITAKSNNSGSVTTKYSINCQNNCQYNEVIDNEIIISNNGVSKVNIITTDANGQEISKEITVKIDKIKPVLTLESNNTFVGNEEVEVCAICYDYDSGCNIDNNSNKICKKYTSSSSNQILSIQDKAGNIGVSSAFDVIISK